MESDDRTARGATADAPAPGLADTSSGCAAPGNRLRAFSRARGGATAVEFGLLALPFLALIGGSLEAGVTFLGQEILQQAVVDAGRQVYTGQFQTNNVGKTTAQLIEQFRTAVCTVNGSPRVTTFNCSKVRISITQADTFGAATPVAATVTDPKTGVSDWNPDFSKYTCGRANGIIVVQAAVDVPVYFPLLGMATATLSGNRRLLQAATVFQVEPFNSTSICGAS